MIEIHFGPISKDHHMLGSIDQATSNSFYRLEKHVLPTLILSRFYDFLEKIVQLLPSASAAHH